MRAEFAAFTAHLEQSPLLVGKIFPTVRKDTEGTVRDNYVVAKSAAPDRVTDARLSMVDVFDADRRYTYDVRVVATSPGGVDLISEVVARQAVGTTLTVAGRVCTAIEIVPNLEKNDDYDDTARLFFRDFSFRFWSNRPA